MHRRIRRTRASAVLSLTAVLLLLLAGCGGLGGSTDDAADFLYSCPLQVTNGTAKRIASFQWILVERRSSGDVLLGALGREPSTLFDPGLELTVVLGPEFAEVFDPSRLEWEVTFVDVEDVRYGPWTVPVSECGATDITVAPGDAI